MRLHAGHGLVVRGHDLVRDGLVDLVGNDTADHGVAVHVDQRHEAIQHGVGGHDEVVHAWQVRAREHDLPDRDEHYKTAGRHGRSGQRAKERGDHEHADLERAQLVLHARGVHDEEHHHGQVHGCAGHVDGGADGHNEVLDRVGHGLGLLDAAHAHGQRGHGGRTTEAEDVGRDHVLHERERVGVREGRENGRHDYEHVQHCRHQKQQRHLERHDHGGDVQHRAEIVTEGAGHQREHGQRREVNDHVDHGHERLVDLAQELEHRVEVYGAVERLGQRDAARDGEGHNGQQRGVHKGGGDVGRHDHLQDRNQVIGQRAARGRGGRRAHERAVDVVGLELGRRVERGSRARDRAVGLLLHVQAVAALDAEHGRVAGSRDLGVVEPEEAREVTETEALEHADEHGEREDQRHADADGVALADVHQVGHGHGQVDEHQRHDDTLDGADVQVAGRVDPLGHGRVHVVVVEQCADTKAEHDADQDDDHVGRGRRGFLLLRRHSVHELVRGAAEFGRRVDIVVADAGRLVVVRDGRARGRGEVGAHHGVRRRRAATGQTRGRAIGVGGGQARQRELAAVAVVDALRVQRDAVRTLHAGC